MYVRFIAVLAFAGIASSALAQQADPNVARSIAAKMWAPQYRPYRLRRRA